MATVKVNSAVRREKATSVRTNAQSINTMIEEMTSEINRLRGTWEGNVAEEAVQKFLNMKSKFEERYTTINAYAQFLENAATEWERINGQIDANIDTVQNLQ